MLGATARSPRQLRGWPSWLSAHRSAIPLLVFLSLVLAPSPLHARTDLLQESVLAAADSVAGLGPNRPNHPVAIIDRYGPGAVLTVSNIQMKVVNNGTLGNPYTFTSSDPSGQWPGASGIDYLFGIFFAVGAVDPTTSDASVVRRVSIGSEWRPPTLDPEDRIYRAYDGIINGSRFVNDDSDHDPFTGEPRIDEDFLDGRDNDGDGLVDEDHAALGQQMYSYVCRDDTREAVNSATLERHVPLGLKANVRVWAYSIEGFQDFNIAEYTITNVSGHTLDSLTMGWQVDLDAGPRQQSDYFSDDFDLPQYPSGEFVIRVGSGTGDLPDPLRRQFPHSPRIDGIVSRDSALCPRVTLRVNGFSVADDNGDDGKTTGIGTFLLIDHTIDPTGASGPTRVGFRSMRFYSGNPTYQQGGPPRVDLERFDFMTGTQNIGEDGFINQTTGETKGDYAAWCSAGPWRNFQNGQSVSATVAFAVSEGTFQKASKYSQDYLRYFNHRFDPNANYGIANLIEAYPSLANAITVQIAFEGQHEPRAGFPQTDFHGRETGIKLPKGSAPTIVVEDCFERRPGDAAREVLVNDREYSWFDFDCDYCTGVWNSVTQEGLFHRTWNAAAPPPNPNTNVSTTFNYTDNPHRSVIPAGDRSVTLSWDNASETTRDPKTGWLDFRGYNLWKVADWTRPVGSPGPAESEWRLLGEFRRFDYSTRDDATGVAIERNYTRDAASGRKNCPLIYVPDPRDTVCVDAVTGQPTGCYRSICLDRGDLWNKQSGEIIRPDWKVPCAPDTGVTSNLDSGVIEFEGGSFALAFPDSGTFDYLCLHHPLQRGRVLVRPGGSDSALVSIVDAGETGFTPSTVVIRPGGHVRWANTSAMNHTVTSDYGCTFVSECIVHRQGCSDPRNREQRVRFPVGRYRYVDREVKNGFAYFYSVTAFDSTTDNSVTTELGGRRAGAEAEAVVPQIAVSANGPKGVWVVPNPYRGYAQIQQRPSA